MSEHRITKHPGSLKHCDSDLKLSQSVSPMHLLRVLIRASPSRCFNWLNERIWWNLLLTRVRLVFSVRRAKQWGVESLVSSLASGGVGGVRHKLWFLSLSLSPHLSLSTTDFVLYFIRNWYQFCLISDINTVNWLGLENNCKIMMEVLNTQNGPSVFLSWESCSVSLWYSDDQSEALRPGQARVTTLPPPSHCTVTSLSRGETWPGHGRSAFMFLCGMSQSVSIFGYNYYSSTAPPPDRTCEGRASGVTGGEGRWGGPSTGQHFSLEILRGLTSLTISPLPHISDTMYTWRDHVVIVNIKSSKHYI